MAKKPKSDPEGDEGESKAEKPNGGRKRLVMAAGAAVLVLGLGAGGYRFVGGKKHEEKAAEALKPPAFFDLPDVLVNLSSAGSERTQYLKVKLVLELPDADVAQKIQPVMPRVLDTFQVFLRELRPADLEGSAGVFRLKEELTRRVNGAIAPNRVNAVLFKEFVIQ